jgi:aspartokinase
MKRLVVKFGGTSVGSAKAIGQAADIVRDLRAEGHHVAVVTSAMSGVTDALLGGASAATSGHPDKVSGFVQTVRDRHEQAIQELQLSPDPGWTSSCCSVMRSAFSVKPRRARSTQ